MNSHAKILEIGPYPPPYDGWSMRIWVVKSALEKGGHICVPLNLGKNRKTPSSDYECVRGGWEYLQKLVRYAVRGYVYHIHTNGEHPKGLVLTLIAYVVSLLAGRRPVLSIHGGTDQVYFPRSKSRSLVPLFQLIFGLSKAVICDNPEVARCIIDYGVTPNKVFPISPFTAQYLEIPPQELDEGIECFLNSHAPVVLTYVECRPEYDLDSLFRAVEILSRRAPRLGLIIVGASSETETIARLLRAAGIDGRSLHLGAVDHSTFLSLLRRVAVYLRSNKTEGTSASIREALHFGVPVVANDAESHPKGVFVYPWGNAEAMSETAEAALANAAVAQLPQTPPDVLAIPDTVSEEVDVLARCALREKIKSSAF